MQNRGRIRDFAMLTVLSAAVAIGLNTLLLFIDLAQYSERYQKAADILYSVSITEQILYSGIFMPILEELLFRGLIFRLLKKWMTFLWAMVTSAFLFGIYHGNLVQFVYATVCGLLFAYLYEKNDSVLVPIWSHMVMNLVSILLTATGVFSWMMSFQ